MMNSNWDYGYGATFDCRFCLGEAFVCRCSEKVNCDIIRRRKGATILGCLVVIGPRGVPRVLERLRDRKGKIIYTAFEAPETGDPGYRMSCYGEYAAGKPGVKTPDEDWDWFKCDCIPYERCAWCAEYAADTTWKWGSRTLTVEEKLEMSLSAIIAITGETEAERTEARLMAEEGK